MFKTGVVVEVLLIDRLGQHKCSILMLWNSVYKKAVLIPPCWGDRTWKRLAMVTTAILEDCRHGGIFPLKWNGKRGSPGGGKQWSLDPARRVELGDGWFSLFAVYCIILAGISNHPLV